MDFPETRKGFAEMAHLWKNATSDQRTRLVMGFVGIAWMGIALVWQFGWAGVLFVSGFLLDYISVKRKG